MEADLNEFEDMLEGLYSQGRFDSSGTFTLSSERALEKLGSFRLANPSHYILNLVGASVGAGADRIDLDWSPFETRLRARGAVFSQSILADVFHYTLSSPNTPAEHALQELAIGLRGAQNLPLRWLTVESWNHDQGHRLWLGLSEPHVERLPGPLAEPHTLITIAYKRRPLLWFKRCLDESEREAVRERCLGFELDLWIDGQPLPYHSPVEEPLAMHQWSGGYVALGRNRQLGRGANSELIVMVRGLAFRRPLKLGIGDVEALVRRDDLHKDLSQTGLVEDERYLEVLSLVNRTAHELKLHLVEHGNLPDDASHRPLLRQVARSLRTRGAMTRSLRLLERLDGSELQRACLFYYLGDFAQASALLEAELPRLDEHARSNRYMNLAAISARRGDLDGAQAYWEEAKKLYRRLHSLRKPHVVAESLEGGLWWLAPTGSDPEVLWDLWKQAQHLKVHLGSRHRRQISLLEVGAWLALHTDQPVQALELAGRANQLRVECYGEVNPSRGESITLEVLASLCLEGLLKASRAAAQKGVATPGVDEVLERLCMLDPVAAARFTG
ncbi:MAG: hypothetical protein KC910_06840 [Candidatus Eremiobacteraeota bacterium]|nr:hypothetical protein [Candidatus Eremiobacteraeota bacterium]